MLHGNTTTMLHILAVPVNPTAVNMPMTLLTVCDANEKELESFVADYSFDSNGCRMCHYDQRSFDGTVAVVPIEFGTWSIYRKQIEQIIHLMSHKQMAMPPRPCQGNVVQRVSL